MIKIKLYVRKQMIRQNQKSINISVEEMIYCLTHFCSQNIFLHDLIKRAELLSRKKILSRQSIVFFFLIIINIYIMSVCFKILLE